MQCMHANARGPWQAVIWALQLHHIPRSNAQFTASNAAGSAFKVMCMAAYPCQWTSSHTKELSHPNASLWPQAHPAGSVRQCRSVAAVAAQATDREAHNRRQADAFDARAAQEFLEPLPVDVTKRLEQIVAAVPDLGPASRVIDVGSGTGALIPFLQARGVKDILAVDLSPAMLQGFQDRAPPPGSLGNDTGVRTWQGDVVDLPAYQGPASTVFFNAVFGNVHDQRDALLAASLLLSPGGYIVISHPLGREWLAGLHRNNPDQVPHELPDREGLKALTRDLPLVGVSYLDNTDLYIACLQVPPGFRHPAAPIYLDGDVTTGFGRGSKQMGVPTANLPPAPLAEKLKDLPAGVYFGWAQLQWAVSNRQRPPADFGVHKMVMNVGVRPTLDDAGGLTVEVHVLHNFSADFYGEPMRVVGLGYLRPEMKFKSIQTLINRIRADIGVAKAQLDTPDLAYFASDPYFAAVD